MSLPRAEALIKLLHATGSCKDGGFRNRETLVDGQYGETVELK